MQSNSFLLYGANGYTGKLIIDEAAAYGLQPILAGRNKSEISKLAEAYHLQYKIVDLNNKEALHNALKDVSVVLHAAGPFRYTSLPMIEACLQTGTHYVDITGEIKTFEIAQQHAAKAMEKGIMLLPGAGFDVVPTDCLALSLKAEMPDATKLKLAFTSTGGQVSGGTAKSILEKLGEKSTVREAGNLVSKPLGQKGQWIKFGDKRVFTMTAPLGDVFTAYYSTGIPNIEGYVGVSEKAYKILKYQWLFNPLLRTSFVRNFIRNRIDKRPPGPTPEQRANSKTLIWGEVENDKGQKLQGGFILCQWVHLYGA